MRKIDFKKIGLAAMMLLSGLTFQSCDNDNDTDWDRVFPNALVTVKKSGDACYIIDDNTTLLAKNLKPTIFDGKEVRALVNYSQTSENSEKYNQVIHVNWIDSILTKKPVPSLGSDTENREKYGDDMVDIVRDWVTVADWLSHPPFPCSLGQSPKVHYINLVRGVNPDNPYEVELRHNANGDPQNYWRDALVAFNLNGVVPDTEGKTVKLTIRWHSSQGYKKVDFNYCSRKPISSPKMLKRVPQPGRKRYPINEEKADKAKAPMHDAPGLFLLPLKAAAACYARGW